MAQQLPKVKSMKSKNGLITITHHTFEVAHVDLRTAVTTGTTTKMVNTHTPQQLRNYLYEQLKMLVDFIDAKKTLDDKGIIFTVESLIEDFPIMKVEEWQIAFKEIAKGRYGKLYERFKTAEVIECVRQFESDRATIYEEQHKSTTQELKVNLTTILSNLKLGEIEIEGEKVGTLGSQLKKTLSNDAPNKES